MTELQLRALDKIYQILYKRGLEAEKSAYPGADNTGADFDETTDIVMQLHYTAVSPGCQGIQHDNNDETDGHNSTATTQQKATNQ